MNDLIQRTGSYVPVLFFDTIILKFKIMKLISAFIILLFIHFTLILKAQDSPVFSTGTISTTASTTAVPITATGFSNITSGNLKLIYDPAVAIPTAVLKEPELAGTFDYNISEPGIIRIGWFTFPAVSLNDGSILFNIKFNKVGAGTSVISFDGKASDMDCQFYNGSHLKLNDIPFDTYFLPGSLTFFNENTAPVTTAPDLTAVLNENVVVPITVNGFNKVGAVSLILNYDPAVLEFKSAENTGGFPGIVIFNPLPGTITVSGTSNDPAGYTLTDGTVFFTMNFTYLGGTTDLSWADEDRSCEYAGPQSAFVYDDIPQSEYYINGLIGQCPEPDAPAVNLVHPTCDAPGSASISNFNAAYTYTFTPEGPAAGAGGNIIGIIAGQSYTVKAVSSGGCMSIASGSFTIEDAPEAPEQPVVEVGAATCDAPGSAFISNFNAAYTYTFTPEGPVAGIGGNIIGFIAGQSYTVKAVSSGGCMSIASGSFTIEDAGEAPEKPVVEVGAATCEAPGSAFIKNFNAAYTYTFTPEGPAAGTGGNITGIIAGQSYTVKAVSSGGCKSIASGSFTIEDAGEAPEQPVVEVGAATCEAPGSAFIKNFNAAYTYTFTPEGPAAGTGGNITGIIAGQSYTAKAVNSGGCKSMASGSFTIEDAPEAPEQPVVEVGAATCEAPGSAFIKNFNAAYTYTFTPEGPAAGTGGNITGIIAGQSYTAKAVNSGGCKSMASGSFTIEDAPEAPEQPVVEVGAATCEAPGSAFIKNFNAAYTYTFTPEGPAAGTGGNITGIIAGQSYTAKAVNSGGCKSMASGSFTIEDAPEAPEQPVVEVGAATCEAPGSAFIKNFNAAYTYTFTPEGPAAGTGGNITGIIAGQSYTAKAVNSGGCKSMASGSFTIEDAGEAPEQPVVEVGAATCEAKRSAFIKNFNAAYTYTFTPEGPVADTGGNITGIIAGQSYTVKAVSSGGCMSIASGSFTIEDAGEAPEQPVVEVGTATCEAPGSAFISNFNAAYTYTFTPEGPAAGTGGNITGIIAGQSYTVKAVSSGGCMSIASGSFTIEDAGEAPEQPVVEVGAATCEAPGSAFIKNFNAAYTYSFTPEGPAAGTGGNITCFISGQSYTVKAVSSGGCMSIASGSFTIEDAPEAPEQPVVEVGAATCEAPGSAFISNFNAAYTYTFTPEGPAAGTGGNIIGFIAGQSYTVKAVSSGGCKSMASGSFTIEDAGEAPEQPVVEVGTATCEAPGSAFIKNFNAAYTYTFTPEGPVAGTGGNITGFIAGQFYTVKAVSSGGCKSMASGSFTIEDAGEAPEQPVVEVGAATCEAPGSAFIKNFNAAYTYTFTPEGPVAGTGGNITGFIAGQSYTVKAVSSGGCKSIASGSFTIEDAGEAPEQPVVEVGAATCEAPGSAFISNFNAAYTYTFTPEGPVAGTGGNITGFRTGQSYTVTAGSAGCESLTSETFTVEAIMEAPEPTITSTDNSGCNECEGVMLTASAGECYLWSTGETTQSIVATTTGYYSVEVTYKNGCSAISMPIYIPVIPTQIIEAEKFKGNLKVYPNPFSEQLKIEFFSPETTHACLEIFDMNGQLIKNIFNCDVEDGMIYKACFYPENLIPNVYFYKLILGNNIYNGKVVYNKK